MPDKSNFTPNEWKLLLESMMMAGIAVSAAEPSDLWGLLKQSFAEGNALMTAKMNPAADALIKAVVADFETAEGRSTARDGLIDQLKRQTRYAALMGIIAVAMGLLVGRRLANHAVMRETGRGLA